MKTIEDVRRKYERLVHDIPYEHAPRLEDWNIILALLAVLEAVDNASLPCERTDHFCHQGRGEQRCSRCSLRDKHAAALAALGVGDE